MAVLRSAARNKLSASTFGLPGERKYPMPDKSHARNAKARASQMLHAGRLSGSQKARIDAKANRILGKAAGGRVADVKLSHTPTQAEKGPVDHLGHDAGQTTLNPVTRDFPTPGSRVIHSDEYGAVHHTGGHTMSDWSD